MTRDNWPIQIAYKTIRILLQVIFIKDGFKDSELIKKSYSSHIFHIISFLDFFSKWCQVNSKKPFCMTYFSTHERIHRGSFLYGLPSMGRYYPNWVKTQLGSYQLSAVSPPNERRASIQPGNFERKFISLLYQFYNHLVKRH